LWEAGVKAFKSMNSESGNTSGNNPGLWDRPFFFLNLSFFLVFTNIAFLYLYPLALEAMGNGNHVIGLVMGIFSAAAVISRPFLGKLVALKGEYRVISSGMAICFLSSLSYNVITAFGFNMLLVRVIHGIGFSAFISAGFSLAAKAFPPEKRGETFGILGAAIMGAVALAPPFGEILIRKWGFPGLYSAASASILLAWIAAFMATHPMSPCLPGEDDKTDVRFFRLLKNRSFLFLLISTIIFAHCQSTVPNFLALIAAEKGTASGPFFFVSYSVSILILVFMGRPIDRYGKLIFMRLAYPFFCLGILFVPVMIRTAFFPVPAILFGAGMGLLFAAHNALAADHGSQMEKPAVMSIFTAVYDTGFITGAVLSGWFAHLTSLDLLFRACGILGFIGLFVVLVSPIKDK
jgi:MFS family permease